MGNPAIRIDRRQFLAAGAGLAGAAILGSSHAQPSEAAREPASHHKVWVWQFGEDGSREEILSVLAQNGLGILLKTHDGVTWMSKWDKAPTAIDGPDKIRETAAFCEAAGVPFHAWCVVRGREPEREAQMAHEVLSSGARSITFNLEPNENGHYWQTGPSEALQMGAELRRLQPNAYLVVAPDPRPWQVKVVPMAEFAGFCDEIAPQTYWDTFNSSANYRLLRDHGFQVGPDGVTPELILDVTHATLRDLGRPICPVGQGASGREAWQRFVNHSYSLGMDAVSVWRFGTARGELWPLLREMAPRRPEPAPEAAPEPQPEEPKQEEPKKVTNSLTMRSQTTTTKRDTSPEIVKASNANETLRWQTGTSAQANKKPASSDPAPDTEAKVISLWQKLVK